MEAGLFLRRNLESQDGVNRGLEEEAGLFKIPPYKGAKPPADETYFLVKTGNTTRIYTRPRLGRLSPDDPGAKLRPFWSQAKYAIVNFSNSL